MDLYLIFTICMVLAAAFAYINFRFLKLPAAIGIMILALVLSVLIIITGNFNPAFYRYALSVIHAIDFSNLLMKVMLGFLLFAGAIHIHAPSLKKESLPILTLATLGTILSTFIIGYLFYFTLQLLKVPMDIIYCLLFGSLISPTDPVAVLGILKKAGVPPSLELKIAGESLFNDGVAVVIFISILEIASAGAGQFTAADISLLFLKEAGGGILFGFVLGYAGFLLLRSIDNYQVELMITIAIVMGGYAAADALHISGPLAMVVAGIITGNNSKQHAMSETTRDYISKFWELMDELLNAILFILVGFEMLEIKMDLTLFLAGVISIGIALLGRYIGVAFPLLGLRWIKTFEKNVVPILTWGGLRGGISIALALSIPAEMHRDRIVAVTYIVVLFSILVQGLTIGKVARKLSA